MGLGTLVALAVAVMFIAAIASFALRRRTLQLPPGDSIPPPGPAPLAQPRRSETSGSSAVARVTPEQAELGSPATFAPPARQAFPSHRDPKPPPPAAPSVEAAKLVEPLEPVSAVQPIEPAEPLESVSSVQPIEPSGPAESVELPKDESRDGIAPQQPAESVERAPSQPSPPQPPRAHFGEQVAAFKKGLASTRGGFIARLSRLFVGRKEIDPALLDQMREVLISADLGVRTTEKLLARLRERHQRAELDAEDAIWAALREEALAILRGPMTGGVRSSRKPTTILVVGVNGVGKTTTIGKLASRLQESGRKVLLAAGDTFRAAAVLQLEVWARRVGCDIVKGKERADPASVIFDAIKKAQAEGGDVVIADTAGRLHTKSNLMEELKKIVRTAEKALERPVDEILLVLDATTGQNAIQQAQLFKEAIPVSGIVLTKLDGTAKGGVVLGIVDEHRIPVRYVGIGERIEDLRQFDPDAFVHALFSKPDEGPAGP